MQAARSGAKLNRFSTWYIGFSSSFTFSPPESRRVVERESLHLSISRRRNERRQSESKKKNVWRETESVAKAREVDFGHVSTIREINPCNPLQTSIIPMCVGIAARGVKWRCTDSSTTFRKWEIRESLSFSLAGSPMGTCSLWGPPFGLSWTSYSFVLTRIAVALSYPDETRNFSIQQAIIYTFPFTTDFDIRAELVV